MTPDELRDGIFNLRTRRFGSVAEVMIKKLKNLGKSLNQFHDLYDDARQHKIEVKFSTVRKASKRRIREDTVLDCIKDELHAERTVTFASWNQTDFDCNIQQVKRAEFDILYYGLFFYDQVVIFRIRREEIGPNIYYSDKQHKGNKGEGQFHINQQTMQIHLDNYHYRALTYQELLELLNAEPVNEP